MSWRRARAVPTAPVTSTHIANARKHFSFIPVRYTPKLLTNSEPPDSSQTQEKLHEQTATTSTSALLNPLVEISYLLNVPGLARSSLPARQSPIRKRQFQIDMIAAQLFLLVLTRA